MTDTLTAPERALAFPLSEYQDRMARCRSAMETLGIDALLVTAPENICYLSGFTTPGYHVFQGLVVPLHAEPFMVLRNIEVDNLHLHSWLTEVVEIENLDRPDETLIPALTRRLGAGVRLGFDDSSTSLPPALVSRVATGMVGGELVASGGLVESLRVVKSERELEYVRQAVGIAETALREGVRAFTNARTDSEVAGVVQASLMVQGSEFTGSPSYVVGNAASADAHALHDRRPLGDGSALWLEISASVQRYHACVSRTAFRGTPPPIAVEAFDASRQALEAMVAAAADGVTAGEVDAAGRTVVGNLGFADAWKNRAAYSIGLSFPPGLGEGHIMDIKPGDDRVLRSGMTFHLIPILKVPGVGAMGCTETVVVGERSGTSLCSLPRRLMVAGEEAVL
jgi:Xaa-Pro dipeptidase